MRTTKRDACLRCQGLLVHELCADHEYSDERAWNMYCLNCGARYWPPLKPLEPRTNIVDTLLEELRNSPGGLRRIFNRKGVL